MGKYLIVFALGFGLAFEIFYQSEKPVEFSAKTSEVVSGETADPELAVSPLASGQTYKVVRVIDGDTIELTNGEKVRYIGIDTPESVDPRKPVQCFGAEATKRNKELVEGKNVRLERDITDRDRFGRLLRFVYVGDLFINLEMVRQGYAYAHDYPPDIAKSEVLHNAEKEAREAGRGLWGSCPTLSGGTAQTAPSLAPRSSQSEVGCTIKGNVSSSGEKIYHVSGCGSYAKTSIDTARGEKWFCTESEAQSAGWRKAGNC